MTMSVCLVVHGYNIYIYWRKSDSLATRTSKEYKRSAKITRLLNEKREQTVNSELWRHIYILGMWRSILGVCWRWAGEASAMKKMKLHNEALHACSGGTHCWVGPHSQHYTSPPLLGWSTLTELYLNNGRRQCLPATATTATQLQPTEAITRAKAREWMKRWNG